MCVCLRRVLDSQINGTVSYTPPVIRVERDELLSVGIRHGLLLATCRPIPVEASGSVIGEGSVGSEPATLFRAEFYQLAGSGRIRYPTVHL